ncbi:MAG: relaxase/mobilization nuclease domain-containing protein [Lachnospiraceae bacterium]
MAVTKIIPIHTTIDKSITYICNASKTEQCLYIHSENCFPQTASIEFDFLYRQAQSGANTLGRHLIQSFAPDEVTPEQAHEIGKQLAKKHLNGEYALVMSTHVDRNHIHNHFVWCAVNVKSHNRYRSNRGTYHEIQRQSDELCKENGLSVIEIKSGKKGKTKHELEHISKGTSYKENLRIDIDKTIITSTNFDDFIQQMKLQGYEVKQGKYLSFKHTNTERFTRTQTLGDAYSISNIKSKIDGRPIKTTLKKLHNLNDDKFQNSKGLLYWASIQNAKISAATLSLFRSKGFTDLEDFQNKYATINASYDVALSNLKSTENEIKTLKELQTKLRIYGRTKEVYTAFSKAHNKDKFIRDNAGAESDIMLHETAKRYLKSYKNKYGNVPNSKEVKEKLQALEQKKSKQYEEYKQIKGEQSEMMKLQSNLQKMIGKNINEREEFNER